MIHTNPRPVFLTHSLSPSLDKPTNLSLRPSRPLIATQYPSSSTNSIVPRARNTIHLTAWRMLSFHIHLFHKGPRMLPRIFLSLALFATPLIAQTTQTTDPIIHTDADLQQREATLTETAKASPTGLAVGRLDDYGNDYTLLVVRTRTGDAERHELFADQIVMKEGTITLVTGGTMQGEHPNTTAGRPGETLGSGIEGGKEVVLHAGHIAHIPAGIPHWVKLAPNTTTTYIVFKEK